MAADTALIQLSGNLAALVEQAGAGVVAVDCAGRPGPSGILWRPGLVVTAEEVLEEEGEIGVTLAGGERVAATLVGRDPSTDVALLRIEAAAQAPSRSGAAPLKPGHLVLAVGSQAGQALASLGIAGYVGGAWQSQRGGTIDRMIKLDLTLQPSLEGGALVDMAGLVIGMVVSGPRRRVLAIPAATIERAVDQLLAKGYVARGYLGAGLQRVTLNGASGEAEATGVLVVNLDPDGPAAAAGLLVGDVVTTWNGTEVARVRDVMRLLGPDSVGKPASLELVRGGARTTLEVKVGERRLA